MQTINAPVVVFVFTHDALKKWNKLNIKTRGCVLYYKFWWKYSENLNEIH